MLRHHVITFIVALAVVASCGKKKENKPAEAEAQLNPAVEASKGFHAILREVHEKLPAATALTETPCPAGAVTPKEGQPPYLWAIERDLVELFATEGASWKKRGIEPGAIRASSETFMSEDRLNEVRTQWYGSKEVRDGIEANNGFALIYSVNSQGTVFTRPQFAVIVPVERKEPDLATAGTFTPGKVDAWIVVWDTAQHQHVCATRFVATNTDEITYRAKGNPLSSLAGDLQSNYYDAAQAALEKIAPGTTIYESQRAASQNH